MGYSEPCKVCGAPLVDEMFIDGLGELPRPHHATDDARIACLELEHSKACKIPEIERKCQECGTALSVRNDDKVCWECVTGGTLNHRIGAPITVLDLFAAIYVAGKLSHGQPETDLGNAYQVASAFVKQRKEFLGKFFSSYSPQKPS